MLTIPILSPGYLGLYSWYGLESFALASSTRAWPSSVISDCFTRMTLTDGTWDYLILLLACPPCSRIRSGAQQFWTFIHAEIYLTDCSFRGRSVLRCFHLVLVFTC